MEIATMEKGKASTANITAKTITTKRTTCTSTRLLSEAAMIVATMQSASELIFGEGFCCV
jgi:hypothetical protein